MNKAKNSVPPASDDVKRRGNKYKRQRSLGWLWGLIALILVVAIGWAVFNNTRTIPDKVTGITTYTNLSQTHTTDPVTYPQSPPVGGPHSPVWQNCGVYDKPIANVNAVHSMEHGAVWITYQPDLSAADVDQLRQLAHRHSYVVLSPYPGLSSPVVATAWGVQLQASGVNDSRLSTFLNKYEQGSQTPELGAACTGGIGNPL